MHWLLAVLVVIVAGICFCLGQMRGRTKRTGEIEKALRPFIAALANMRLSQHPLNFSLYEDALAPAERKLQQIFPNLSAELSVENFRRLVAWMNAWQSQFVIAMVNDGQMGLYELKTIQGVCDIIHPDTRLNALVCEAGRVRSTVPNTIFPRVLVLHDIEQQLEELLSSSDVSESAKIAARCRLEEQQARTGSEMPKGQLDPF